MICIFETNQWGDVYEFCSDLLPEPPTVVRNLGVGHGAKKEEGLEAGAPAAAEAEKEGP